MTADNHSIIIKTKENKGEGNNMFCNQCGAQIDENANFCNKCGYKIPKPEMGSIIFAREKQFYGSLVKMKVYIDGQLAASVGPGEEAKVNVTIGTHQIAFDLWSGNNVENITITKESPNIKINFKLGTGLITTKPKITSIENV